uniref:LysM domain-containing protein n=1 Tax=Pseudictyota dubia TaxID=2749911 RepID=A0A7R9WGD9_9STRA|mmetsp:Transcript_49322/g.91343  ORF Transcript_49322/g.91343 Transcript_49322/m.91343 type:complete len:344 (+) Transcript_49322:66-1097(+)|eukprot:CAMPEP_0197442494 /NCGR_PEP_ID=MMETSP1175-20131217/8498_1 /TAXON_ID=1003142 /ORGANISM="Triceratium dubium, Strain CCMP147" /LENGTH=343 /DNA_ID=CAMNT_0042972981 /DNA_START=56 /DNA_END=1087 /DNA_ORIENTATION=-
MAEGGQFPWKVQKVDTSRGPPGSYDHISRKEPLPLPPVGTTWVLDKETREWSLTRCDAAGEPDPKSSHLAASLAQHQGQGKDISAKKGDEIGGKVPVANSADDVCRSIPPPPRSSSSVLSEDAVEGVDYVVHTVLPSDTFSGLCLRYKISALQLRRANRFSGTNLKLAPSRLVIPLEKDGLKGGRVRVQDRESPEYKLHEVMAAVPGLGNSAEARAYLLMSGWDVDEAIDAAKSDLGWEKDNEELASRRMDVVTTSKSVGRGHGENGEVEIGWKDEPDAVADEECSLTLHVHVAVPADPSACSQGQLTGEGDEEKNCEATDGLMTPLLTRELELPRITRRSHV